MGADARDQPGGAPDGSFDELVSSLGGGNASQELKRLPLILNVYEVFKLTDAIDNRDVVEGRADNKDPLARETLLLLGSAYIEVAPKFPKTAEDKKKLATVTILITEDMAWLLRGKVKSGDLAIDGVTPIGVSLLTKLYELLLSFNSGIGDLKINNRPEVRRTDVRDKLQKRGGN